MELPKIINCEECIEFLKEILNHESLDKWNI